MSKTQSAGNRKKMRAQTEYMTLIVISDLPNNQFLINSKESTDTHIITVKDDEATNCTCPSDKYERTCKHKIAYETENINEVKINSHRVCTN